MKTQFMAVEEALPIVLDLANDALTRIESNGSETIAERDKQQLAIDTVEDFYINNVAE